MPIIEETITENNTSKAMHIIITSIALAQLFGQGITSASCRINRIDTNVAGKIHNDIIAGVSNPLFAADINRIDAIKGRVMMANRGVLNPKKIYKIRTKMVIDSSIFLTLHKTCNNLYHRQENA
ncbi:MAG: hypothetical protein ABSE89_11930 [Sedimentisphaerales bacterium]